MLKEKYFYYFLLLISNFIWLRRSLPVEIHQYGFNALSELSGYLKLPSRFKSTGRYSCPAFERASEITDIMIAKIFSNLLVGKAANIEKV